MLRTIVKENPNLRAMMIELRRAAAAQKAPIWADVARNLARPRHQYRPVNVSRVERFASAGSTVVVPGKLLAAGRLTKQVTIAALSASEGARLKVHQAGGRLVTIPDLLKSHPNGSGVRLLA